MGLHVWPRGHVFKVGHLVAGIGGYKRYSFKLSSSEMDMPDSVFSRLRPFPAALEVGWKRRMVQCIGGDWE